MSRLSALLEKGEAIPEIEVAECEGEFYLTKGLESARAYAFNFSTFIPVTISEGTPDTDKFVRMKNSL